MFNLLLQPRTDAKLLVLDLDHTLWDGSAQVEELSQKLRPGLFDFFLKVVGHYDIIIWSNNPKRVLMIKLQALGLLNQDLRVIAVLDRSLINTCRGKRAKALEVIWHQLKCYNTHNTIHVDDLEENFSLNPRQGLKIKPFKVGHQDDCELRVLGEYLVRLAKVKDFNEYSHDNWRN